MMRLVRVFIVLSIFLTNFSFAQVISSERVKAGWKTANKKSMNKGGIKNVKTPPLPGETMPVKVYTSILPVTFSRAEMNEEEEWVIGSNISIGGSYVKMIGIGTGLDGGSVRVEPHYFYGVTGSFGVSQNTGVEGGITEGLMFGGIVGFPGFSALFGYDFFLKTPVLGIGTSLSILTLTDKGSFIRPF